MKQSKNKKSSKSKTSTKQQKKKIIQNKSKKKVVQKVKSTKKVAQKKVKQTGGSGATLKPLVNKKTNKKEPINLEEKQKEEDKNKREVGKNQLDLHRLRWEMNVESERGNLPRVQELLKEHDKLTLKTKDLLSK